LENIRRDSTILGYGYSFPIIDWYKGIFWESPPSWERLPSSLYTPDTYFGSRCELSRRWYIKQASLYQIDIDKTPFYHIDIDNSI